MGTTNTNTYYWEYKPKGLISQERSVKALDGAAGQQFSDVEGEICTSLTQKAAVAGWAGPAGTENSMRVRLK